MRVTVVLLLAILAITMAKKSKKPKGPKLVPLKDNVETVGYFSGKAKGKKGKGIGYYLTYEGDWKDGAWDGAGTLHLPGGAHFAGNFADGTPSSVASSSSGSTSGFQGIVSALSGAPTSCPFKDNGDRFTVRGKGKLRNAYIGGKKVALYLGGTRGKGRKAVPHGTGKLYMMTYRGTWKKSKTGMEWNGNGQLFLGGGAVFTGSF